MAIHKRIAFIFCITIFSTCLFNNAKAQVLICNQLKEIVKLIDTDPTMSSIRGEVVNKSDATGSRIDYATSAAIWEPADSYELLTQKIKYRKTDGRFTYRTIFTEGMMMNVGPVAKFKGMVQNCLGEEWVNANIDAGQTDTVCYLKNLRTFVIIKIETELDRLTLECYK